MPGNERDERGDCPRCYASTQCLAIDWGDEASLIREVFRIARTDISPDASRRRQERRPKPLHL